MCLGKIADVQVGAENDFPRERRELLQQGLEEGGLSCAVGADDGRNTLRAVGVRSGKEKRVFLSS